MSFMPFRWLHETAWATGIRESTLLFPLVESIHFVNVHFVTGYGDRWSEDPRRRWFPRAAPTRLRGRFLSHPRFCARSKSATQPERLNASNREFLAS